MVDKPKVETVKFPPLEDDCDEHAVVPNATEPTNKKLAANKPTFLKFIFIPFFTIGYLDNG
ncbi:hypothetical protein HMPREF0506_0817 [Lactobacillus crispatus JV-V01]|nr:hypothetical protein HMPREF0506_0817 [Lactobacillus crispatus JV-V01]